MDVNTTEQHIRTMIQGLNTSNQGHIIDQMIADQDAVIFGLLDVLRGYDYPVAWIAEEHYALISTRNGKTDADNYCQMAHLISIVRDAHRDALTY